MSQNVSTWAWCAWFAFAPANLYGEVVHYRQGLFRDLLLLLSTVELWSGKRSVFPGLFLFGKSLVCIWENCTVLDSQNVSSGKGLTRNTGVQLFTLHRNSTRCLRMLNTPKLCQAWCCDSKWGLFKSLTINIPASCTWSFGIFALGFKGSRSSPLGLCSRTLTVRNKSYELVRNISLVVQLSRGLNPLKLTCYKLQN